MLRALTIRIYCVYMCAFLALGQGQDTHITTNTNNPTPPQRATDFMHDFCMHGGIDSCRDPLLLLLHFAAKVNASKQKINKTHMHNINARHAVRISYMQPLLLLLLGLQTKRHSMETGLTSYVERAFSVSDPAAHRGHTQTHGTMSITLHCVRCTTSASCNWTLCHFGCGFAINSEGYVISTFLLNFK